MHRPKNEIICRSFQHPNHQLTVIWIADRKFSLPFQWLKRITGYFSILFWLIISFFFLSFFFSPYWPKDRQFWLFWFGFIFMTNGNKCQAREREEEKTVLVRFFIVFDYFYVGKISMGAMSSKWMYCILANWTNVSNKSTLFPSTFSFSISKYAAAVDQK